MTVIPVANEQTLRTRAWVEGNRRLVDKLSNGQLAYVYLPNTGQPGYSSFNRYYFSQQDKKGAIVDERYNGGGSAADYIIDGLQRDFDGYFNNVAGDRVPFTSPAAGIWGPKVMIINEMAGSGGDLMPYMFRSPQDRRAGRQAHVGRARAYCRHADVRRRRLDDRAARRLLRARRQVGGRERRRRARHRRRELAEGRDRLLDLRHQGGAGGDAADAVAGQREHLGEAVEVHQRAAPVRVAEQLVRPRARPAGNPCRSRRAAGRCRACCASS